MKKLMLTFLGANGLFLVSAGLLLGFCIVSEQQERANKNVDNVAFDVLLTECPLRGMLGQNALNMELIANSYIQPASSTQYSCSSPS